MKETLFSALLLASTLASLQVQTGNVTGRLRLENGQAASGVRVSVTPAPDPGAPNAESMVLSNSALTDGDGRFRLEGVSAGRYFVVAGFVDSPTYYPGVRAAANAKTVSVSAGAIVADVDFTMETPSGGVSVSGRAVMPPGLPAASIQRVVLGSPVGGVAVLGTNAKSDGSFQFLNVRPGTYVIVVFVNGTTPQSRLVAVADKDLTGIDISILPPTPIPPPPANGGVTVSGRAIISESAPVTGARRVFLAYPGGGISPQEFPLGPDGSFLFRNVLPGTYNLVVGGVGLFVPFSVVVADKDLTGIEIDTASIVTLRGTVAVEGGKPQPQFSLSFTSASSARSFNAILAPIGMLLVSLPEGDYRVNLSGLPQGYKVKSVRAGSLDLLANPLKVSRSASGVSIEVILGTD
jgi:hypothetical protein